MCSITATLLSVIFVTYSIANHFKTKVLFNAIFICAADLFILQESLKSSYLSSLKNFRIIYTCVNHFCNHFWLEEIDLKPSGDIEETLGPKPSSNQSFFICHRNLKGISAHNYIKVSFLRAYISTQKLDGICISETCLDSYASDDDDNLKICRLLFNSS